MVAAGSVCVLCMRAGLAKVFRPGANGSAVCDARMSNSNIEPTLCVPELARLSCRNRVGQAKGDVLRADSGRDSISRNGYERDVRVMKRRL